MVIDMSMKQPFLELNRILEALRMQDLRPALEYVCFLSLCYLSPVIILIVDWQRGAFFPHLKCTTRATNC